MVDYLKSVAQMRSLLLESARWSTVINSELENPKIDEHSFCEELFSVFSEKGEEGTPRIIIFQKVSERLKKDIAYFVEKYEIFDKKLNHLKSLILKTPENEYICVWPYEDLDWSRRLYIIGALESLNSGATTVEQVISEDYYSGFTNFIKQKYSVFLDNYAPHCPPKYTGQPDKEKRCCRFCDKKMPEVTFYQNAHAIPEALGNKTYKNNEECDVCNGKFGRGIDQDLVQFFDFYRSLFRIKGKGGYKKVLFENGKSITSKDGLVIIEKTVSDDLVEDTLDFEETFESIKNISLQNVYRALAKSSLSTVPSDIIKNFSKTIDWINGKYDFAECIPTVLLFGDSDFCSNETYIVNYLIISNDEDFPYLISELHFGSIFLVYIVPSDIDKRNYRESMSYQKYFNLLSTYYPKQPWKQFDLSEKIPQKLSYTLTIRKADEV